MGEWLLGRLNIYLREVYEADSDEFEGLEGLTTWTIRKEAKLATLWHIQARSKTRTITRRINQVSRNSNRTYAKITTRQGGDAMDLDVF